MKHCVPCGSVYSFIFIYYLFYLFILVLFVMSFVTFQCSHIVFTNLIIGIPKGI